MNSIAFKIREFNNLLPESTQLVAVSKFHPVEQIKEAYEAGQRLFGESRVQELTAKIPLLPADIKWHFIGHLQTNKVKQLIGKVAMIESVDSEKLLRLINQECIKANVKTNILLQVHVALEESKFGFYAEELIDFLEKKEWIDFKGVEFCGIMGMATNTDDSGLINKDFRRLQSIYQEIKHSYGSLMPKFNQLSMGMSHDWTQAVEHGATLIRIGTGIFGPRI